MHQVHSPFFTHYFLGQQALTKGNALEAYEHWLNCLKVIPEDSDSYRQLANAFRSIGHLTEADNLIREGLGRFPGHFGLLADQANVLLDRGTADAATSQFLELAKATTQNQHQIGTLNFLSNALMSMEYADTGAPEQTKLLAQQWGKLATDWATHLAQSQEIPDWAPKPDPAAPIRIGFLSGDLCDHPVGFLLLPLLQHRTRDAWIPYIYDNGSRNDQTHRQLRNTVPDIHWHCVNNMDDAQAMKHILADQLDVLIDLSGHTGRSRLRLLAHRLAGKQCSWLGFSGTSGLPTIDGIILDDPLGAQCESQFEEEILTLNPSRFCFRPPFAPPVTPPPCEAKGYITFGSFNNTAKYNPRLLTTWAEILKSIPTSKLLLKWRTFADTNFCHHILTQFHTLRIDPSRIELRQFSTHRQMLDEYKDVDIALDTFPFNGGFTSLEALWMGLPLITLAGCRPIARQSTSFIYALNQRGWVGHTIDDYAQIAQRLANDPAQLAAIRLQQRNQIIDSALYDAPSFSKNFEALCRELKIPKNTFGRPHNNNL